MRIEETRLFQALPTTLQRAVSARSNKMRTPAYYPNIAGVNPRRIKGLPPEYIARIQAQQALKSPERYAAPKFSRKKQIFFSALKALGITALLVPGIPTFLAFVLKMFSGMAFMSYPPLAIAVLLGGGALFLVFSIKRQVALREANFHSPDNQASVPNNPTIKKILRMFVAPGLTGILGLGGAMALALPIEHALNLPQGIIGWGFFGLTVISTLVLESSGRVIREAVDVYKFCRYRIQKNWPRRKPFAKMITNIGANTAWLATFWFFCNMSKVYATHTFGWALPNTLHRYYELLNFTHNADPVALAIHLLVFTVGTLGYYLAFRRKSEAKAFPDKPFPLLDNTLVWGTAGAGIGLVTYLTGLDTLATNILSGSITLGWLHATLHSLKSQWAALVMAAREDHIFSLTDLYHRFGPRHASADTRTVYRPAFGMLDTLVSAYIMILISEGCNGVISGPSGCFTTQDFIDAQKMIRDLLLKDETKLRQVILEEFERLEAATNTRESLEAVARALDRMGYFLDDEKGLDGMWTSQKELGLAVPDHEGTPRAEGHLKRLSGMGQLKDDLFNARRAHLDCDLTVQGQHIRQAARIHHCMADMFRRYANEVDAAELEKKIKVVLGEVDAVGSLKRSLAVILDGYYRRAYQHVDVHPVRFWTNLLMYDSYNAKQFAIDFCSQTMADHVGVMEVVVMNPQGQIDILPVRMSMVKDFKEDYKELLSLTGDSTHEEVDFHGRRVTRRRLIKNKDARIGWYHRTDHDMKEDSLCEIHHLDNLAHYQKYENLFKAGRITEEEFLSIYPTAEVPMAPQLKMERCLDPYLSTEGNPYYEDYEFYDLVYKNGARLRIRADGRQILLIRNAQGQVVQMDPLDPAAAEFVPNRSAVLLVGGTKGNDYVAGAIQGGRGNAFFRHIKVEEAMLERLGRGKIPHPFGGGKFFDDDPLTMPRCHFMYPTALISVSDGDQMDWAVTNLHLFFLRSNPHLRLIFRRPRQVELPWDDNLMDRPTDVLFEAGVAVTWMNLKVNLKKNVARKEEVLKILDGYSPETVMDVLDNYAPESEAKTVCFKKDALRRIKRSALLPEDKTRLLSICEAAQKERALTIPLNMNKENERRFGGELWRGIQQGGRVAVNTEDNALILPWHPSVATNPAFDSAFDNQTIDPVTGKYVNRQRIDQVPVPMEMQDLVDMDLIDDQKGITIDRVQFPTTGGPVADVDYLFLRRNNDDSVTDSTRTLELPNRVAQMLIRGTQLLSQEELEHVRITTGDQQIDKKMPWSEKLPGEAQEDIVHLPLSQQEYDALTPWIEKAKAYHGTPPDAYDAAKGELRIRLKHFLQVCETSYGEFCYRRFMPSPQYERYFEPSALTLFFGNDPKSGIQELGKDSPEEKAA